MTIDALNRVMLDNRLDVHFEYSVKEGNISSNLDQGAAEKVCQILKENKIGAEIVKGDGKNVKVIVRREAIPSSSSTEQVGQDVSDLGVSTIKDPVIKDNAGFRKAFSWPNSNGRKFPSIPDQSKVPYKEKNPQFDEKWKGLASRMQGGGRSVYATPDAYILRAQILLDRFLDKNPQFMNKEFQDLHPALMFQALSTTFKVEEDLAIWNLDHAQMLTSGLTSYINPRTIRRDIDSMEQLFLKGVEWNVNTNPSIEADMNTHLLERPLPDGGTTELLADAKTGAFVIQKKDDHYVMDVKTGDGEVVSHEFTFDAEENAVEKLPDSSAEKGRSAESLFALMNQFGGTELIR